jgi:hypothetical protein
MEKTLKYFNQPQNEAMAVNAKDEYIVASRGLGKSEGFDARVMLRNVFAMPRSNGAILSPTYAKLLQNTLPAMAYALSRWGYHRDRHYYIGRRPPKTAGFGKPLREPFSYDHVIAWFNGSIQHLVSFDRSMSTNSMSLDYVIAPEAKFLDHDKIKNEVSPAVRGNREYFGDCPWHGGSFYSTDMPTSKSGMWILEKEKEMDVELIQLIKLLYVEYKSTKEKFDGKETIHSRNKLARLQKELNQLRSNALFFAEYSAIDNVEILGEAWIAKQKRELPPLIFQTAILNQRLRKIPNGFYSSFDEDTHCYTPKASGVLDLLGYDLNKKRNCLWDSDVVATKPICIANNYNAAINNLAVGQTTGRVARTLNSLFVKTPRKLKDVIQDFCDYYEPHICREVIYYYDTTATNQDAAGNLTFYETVINTLQSRGWRVKAVFVGQPMAHVTKHEMINNALNGDVRYLFPMFNRHNCEYLKLALEQTGVKVGAKGFEKDKSAEKFEDSPERPDETKTHVTDAWDTLYIGMTLFPVSSTVDESVSHFIM